MHVICIYYHKIARSWNLEVVTSCDRNEAKDLTNILKTFIAHFSTANHYVKISIELILSIYSNMHTMCILRVIFNEYAIQFVLAPVEKWSYIKCLIKK